MTHWHISESGATVELDPALRGEAMFTVRNQSPVTDRVVLAVEPLDGAADTWLTVEDSPRPPEGGARRQRHVRHDRRGARGGPGGTYGSSPRDWPNTQRDVHHQQADQLHEARPGRRRRNWRKLWPLLLIPVVLLVGSSGALSSQPPTISTNGRSWWTDVDGPKARRRWSRHVTALRRWIAI